MEIITLGASPSPANTARTRTTTVDVKWRDVIHLDIKDHELRRKTEDFLDVLERTAFAYKMQDPRTGAISLQELSGQDMLARMAHIAKVHAQHPKMAKAVKRGTEEAGHTYVTGKLTIGDHARPYDGNLKNGCYTLFADSTPPAPIAISLGRDFIRGARYLGVDGKHHPATIEGVLSNELAHAAFASKSDTLSNQIEGIIVKALGGIQRNEADTTIEFRRNGNRGYRSLLDTNGRNLSSVTQNPAVQFGAMEQAMLASLRLPAIGLVTVASVASVALPASLPTLTPSTPSRG